MPKKTAKVGLVSLKQGDDSKWRVRWWDARTKKYVRRVLPATSYAEAMAMVMAKGYNRELAAGKGFILSMRAKAGHGVSEAIEEMIKNAESIPSPGAATPA